MLAVQVQKQIGCTASGFALDVDIQIEAGSFSAIQGQSGAGKSTLLRILAGLSSPDSGLVQWKNNLWFSGAKKKNLAPGKRKIGLVFQDYSLFPNMSVEKNLSFAASSKSKETKQWISQLLEMAGLNDFSHRKPHQLSGGQQQRVALIRALVNRPEILLLDEPLSALDPRWRERLQEDILKIHRKFKLTTVMVSHDVGEVFKMAGHVVFMHGGKVVECGSPSDIWMKDKEVSGKVQFSAEILSISPDGPLSVLVLRTESGQVRVVSAPEEVAHLKLGDKVLVASKAFNPIIVKQ